MLHVGNTCTYNNPANHLANVLLRDLHWLRVPQRIDYKIAVLVYRCLHRLALVYLSVDLLSASEMTCIVSSGALNSTHSLSLLIYRASRTCHRDSDYGYGRRTRYPSRRRTCPLSTTTLSQLSLHESRTLCRRTFGHPVLWQRSSVGSRPSFSHEVSPTDANARISVSFIRWPHSFGLSQSNLLLSFYY